ncbi:MAG: cytochrome P460 family protein [Verrucomicrobiales bacterium]|nr:cytochrome P460 family protein [Verrucomicrobiales bacterium]
MPRRFCLVALASLSGLLANSSATCGADKPAAVFVGKDTLLRPEGYREWVFVGSSLGLRYDQNSEKSVGTETNRFNNVYLNPAAYREFSASGKFPDGTVLVLEIASAETKKEPGLQGSFQKEFVALEAAVKDSQRFERGWAYFSFDDKSGKLKDRAQPLPQPACYDCHDRKAATDHVFTQFYPVLRANPAK